LKYVNKIGCLFNQFKEGIDSHLPGQCLGFLVSAEAIEEAQENLENAIEDSGIKLGRFRIEMLKNVVTMLGCNG
jgi:hypothetical protein